MSSKRQTHAAALHGRALLAAQDPAVEALATRLWTGVDPDVLSETGGILAGAWFASPTVHLNHELIAAGMLLTGQIDRDTLLEWVSVGWDRAVKAGRPYHPGQKP